MRGWLSLPPGQFCVNRQFHTTHGFVVIGIAFSYIGANDRESLVPVSSEGDFKPWILLLLRLLGNIHIREIRYRPGNREL